MVNKHKFEHNLLRTIDCSNCQQWCTIITNATKQLAHLIITRLNDEWIKENTLERFAEYITENLYWKKINITQLFILIRMAVNWVINDRKLKRNENAYKNLYKIIWILNSMESWLISDYDKLEKDVKEIIDSVSLISETANNDLLDRLFIAVMLEATKIRKFYKPICINNARNGVYKEKRDAKS